MARRELRKMRDMALSVRSLHVVDGPDEFEEIFELAASGKPFDVYSRARLKRVR